jgi:hypothetical protein
MTEKITAIFRYFLIFIFSTTVWSKLVDFGEFKHQLFLSPLIPPDFITQIAILTVISEIVIVISLISDKWRPFGLLFSCFILSLFGFYLLFLVVNFQFNKPCGCGFIFSFLNYNQHIVLNFVLSLIAGASLLFHPKLSQIKSPAN